MPWDGDDDGRAARAGARGSSTPTCDGDGAEQFTDDGWFTTGDVAIGSPDGYFVIADRTKDLIKSGGEWISLGRHGGRDHGACPRSPRPPSSPIPDPKWQERPLACVVVRPGAERHRSTPSRAHLEAHGFAKWQLPDRIELIDAIPKHERRQVRQEGPARPLHA